MRFILNLVQTTKILIFLGLFIWYTTFVFKQGVRVGKATSNPVVEWSLEKLLTDKESP